MVLGFVALSLCTGTAITAFLPGISTGPQRSADVTTRLAKADAQAAYLTLWALPVTMPLTGIDLGIIPVIYPGVYFYSSSGHLEGTMRLDAQGDPNAIFVFQVRPEWGLFCFSVAQRVADCQNACCLSQRLLEEGYRVAHQHPSRQHPCH